jgi:hypothetical protein
MKRSLTAVVTGCAVIALVPATAVAKRNHHRSHVHHARVHRRTFGSDSTTSPGQTGTQNAGPAGTVQSFTGGVLTILLSNGSTVSGQVADTTQIACGATQPSGWGSHDQGQGGNGSGDDNDDQSQSGNPGQGDDDNQSDENGTGQTCSTTDLVAGAGVQEAVLSVSNAGAVWDTVDLVSSSSSSSSSSTSSSDSDD